jgi:acyl-CoA synthetase (AMP-forming)/AMP-acid ligase II
VPESSAAAGNIVDIIGGHAAAVGGRPAIVDSRQSITYAELPARIARAAGWLQQQSVRRGERFGLLLHDHADHFVLLLAAASMGAVSLSLNWQSRPDETRRVADAFGLQKLVHDPGLRVPAEYQAIELKPGMLDAGPALAPIVDAGRLPFRICLTSGTTGRPTGVELTHDQAKDWCEALRLGIGLVRHQRHLSTLPLGFTGSLVFNLPHLMLGNTVELFSSFHAPEEFMAAVRNRGITSCVLVPTMVRRLMALASDDSPLLPELQYLICTASPISAEERRQGLRLLTPGFHEAYGATGAGIISFLLPQDIDAHADSVGRAMPLKEVEIADGDGRRLPAGEIGALRVRGKGVAAGFCDVNAGEPNETFRDGWVHPGELAWMDEAGFIHIAGRTSDLILRGGQNIYPAEIERTLRLHPAVREAAVIGAPSPEYGEEVVAFVQLAGAASEQEIMETCRRQLSPYKVPKAIIPMADFPRNAAGKVLKSELARLLPQRLAAGTEVS